ncbi:MAG TPA: hypothetical protein VIU15_17200 [Streptomyces sp.]
MRATRRAAVAVVAVGASALLGFAAVPAVAAEVSYATHCVPPAGIDPVDGTTKVQVTAPATAKVGDTVDVVWKFVQAASKNPNIIDLPADSVLPTGTLKASGAQSGDVPMEGTRKNPAIPKGGEMVLSDMKGSLKLTAAGEVKLTPDTYVVDAFGTKTNCAPTQVVVPSATITVTGGASNSPSSSASSSPSTSSSPSPSPSSSSSQSPSPSPSNEQTDFTGKVVDVPYTCQSPLGEKKATSPVQINATKNGGSYALTVQFKKSVMNSPAEIPAGSVKPSMEVKLGGADSGTVHVEGPLNSGPIKTGDPIQIPDLKGTYKPGATGQSTLSPGELLIEALGTKTLCKPDQSLVSLTLTTEKQEGGAAGGSSTSGGSSSSTSGGLANTGSNDHGALKALGLVAGTAVLLGGAVFTFMPGRRAR